MQTKGTIATFGPAYGWRLPIAIDSDRSYALFFRGKFEDTWMPSKQVNPKNSKAKKYERQPIPILTEVSEVLAHLQLGPAVAAVILSNHESPLAYRKAWGNSVKEEFNRLLDWEVDDKGEVDD
jgi:hypothetical protein